MSIESAFNAARRHLAQGYASDGGRNSPDDNDWAMADLDINHMTHVELLTLLSLHED